MKTKRLNSPVTHRGRRILHCCNYLLAVCGLLSVPPCPAATPPGFEELAIATGLQSPTTMVFAPDGRLFVSEQAGRLRVIRNGALLATPFLTVDARSDGERGLLGVAFDPNFATNRWVYVYYTSRLTSANRLSRFRASVSNPDVVEAGSEQYLIENIGLTASNHNGGALHFGPDRNLYVSVGEHGTASRAQDLGNLGGKVLRLNPANYPNIIPADNPFVGRTGARGEIWAYGLRNPFTFDFDPATGRMYINDVGQGTYEEVNLGARGANYGWPTCEGPCSTSGMTNPIYYYGHLSGGCAITGGTFYRANQFPSEYYGHYFFADYCADFIQRLRPDNTAVAWGTAFGAPVDLRVGPDGALYVLEYSGGKVTRIRYTGGGANRPPTAVVSATPLSGPTPLTVAFNGSASSDPDGDALSYSWNFGDGSAVSTQVSPSHTYSVAGSYTARLTVSDGRGGTGTATLSIAAGNSAPTGVITAPLQGVLYQAGDTITATGTGTDPQDGTLPPSAFSWTVLFHHDTHTHPFLGPVTGTRSIAFQIPRTGETSTNVWYRIALTVRDSGGLTHTATRDIMPRTTALTLQTVPSGLTVLVDGAPQASPRTFNSVVGMQREIGVTSPQSLNGRSYGFSSWSDGGAAAHLINAPATNTSYTATFTEVVTDVTPPLISGVSASNITSSGATIAWTTNEPANTQVEYGTTTGYGSVTTLVTALTTSHAQALAGLQPATLYHYRVRSRDASGNLAISGDFTFTTLAGGSTAVVAQIRQSCAGISNCYTSLVDWEAAFGGISFGGCAAGDLVCANRIAVAQIDGAWTNPDTSSLRIDGWRTGPNNYIHIYTAPLARHDGKWKTNAYRLVSAAATPALSIQENYVRIEGLQIQTDRISNPGNSNVAIHSYNLVGSTSAGDIRIGNNILRGTPNTSSGHGIFIQEVTAPVVFRVWNNVIYDFPTAGIRDSAFQSGGVPGAVYLFNNLVYRTGTGISVYGTPSGRPVSLYNNIANGNTADYNRYATYSFAGNNISGDSTSPNAPFRNRTVAFVNAAGGDYHLAITDTAARDQGANLSTDPNLPFSTDIDGQTRPSPWDIGPDESSSTAGGANRAPTASASANPLSGPAPLTVAFNGSASSDPDGDALSYSWNFGDGSANSTSVSPVHTYSGVGSFIARLTVSDGRGGTATATVTITTTGTQTTDTTPPVIMGVGVTGITSSGGTAVCRTDEPASIQVEYGPTAAYGSITPQSTPLSTLPQQAISGLQPATLYHYRLRARDASGNLRISNDFTFTTLAAAGGTTVVAQIRASCAGVSNCYTSLAAWEAAYGGIAFGGCAAGDLVCANRIAVAQIDGTWTNPDITPVRIDGWRTGPNNYIQIYTAPAARHDGKWKTTAYRLVSAASAAALRIEESYVRIDGLQIQADRTTNSSNPNVGIHSYNLGGSTTAGDIRISNNIVRGTPNTPSGYGIFIEEILAPAVFKIWNNVIYGFPSAGIRDSTFNQSGVPGGFYIFNNLVHSTGVGISVYGAPSGRPVSLYNNIASGNTNDYNPYAAYSWAGNNVSRDATSPNAGYRNRIVAFVNAAGGDFHLAATDTAARNQGANLSADPNIPFSNDIDGQARTSPWDIGPDESQ